MGSWCLHQHPALTDDKPPSPCNEPLQPKSQRKGRGLFPATPWQYPVFAGGSPMFWEAISTFQLIIAAGIILQLRTWVPVLTYLKSGARCRGCRAGSLFLHHWQPRIHGVPSVHTLLHFLSLVCFSNTLPTELIEMMFHVLLSGLWPSKTPSL